MYARLRLSELADRLRTAYEGFGRRDMDAVLSVMDPDIEWDATDALAVMRVCSERQRSTAREASRQFSVPFTPSTR